SPLTLTLFPYTTLFRSHGLACHDPYRDITLIAFDQSTRWAEERVGPERSIRLDCCAADLRIIGRLGLFGPRLSSLNSERGGLERSEEHTSELQSRFDLV